MHKKLVDINVSSLKLSVFTRPCAPSPRRRARFTRRGYIQGQAGARLRWTLRFVHGVPCVHGSLFHRVQCRYGQAHSREGQNSVGCCQGSMYLLKWSSYMNNCHMRTHLSGGSSALQPVGSTANEAFHAELGAAFRQVYSIHPPILRLRLEYLVLSKQVVFECATRVQGLRQRRPTEILFLALARPLLDEMSWSSWCDVDPGRTFVRKETLPSRKVRLQDVARVRLWSAKKNPVAKPKKKVVKRTVFTRKRRLHLSGAGAHW